MIIINKEYILIGAIFVLLLACIAYIIFLRKRNKRLSISSLHIDSALKRSLAVFNTKFIGIEYFDKHGYLVNINDEALKILGIEESGEDVVKKRIHYRDFESTKQDIYKSSIDVEIPYKGSEKSAILDNIHAGGFLEGHVEYDLRDSTKNTIIAANGRDCLMLSFRIIPIIIDGQFDGFVSMFVDITEQVHKQRNTEKKHALMMKAFDNMPIAILLKDTKNDKIIYWNKKSVSMFGEDILQSTNMYYHEYDLERIKKIDRQILETGEFMVYGNSLKLKNGRQVDHIVHKSVMENAEDGILIVAVVESAIIGELQQINKISSIKSDNLKAYIWDYNLATNKIEYTNRAVPTVSDRCNNLDDFLQVFSARDQVMTRKLLDDVRNGLRKELIYNYSKFNFKTNKTEHWESIVIAEDVNGGDQVQRHLYGVDIDITDQVNSIKKLKDAKKNAEKTNELKSMFLANMSHEIRTPLNAIVGFSDLLASAENEEEREEFSDIINTNSEMLLNLINSILDISKIEAGLINFKNEAFDMSELIDEIILSFKQRFEKEDLQIYHEKSHEVCNIKLDRERLVQIITNFMSNAVKFTTKGSIILGYTCSDEKLKIYVKDTGVGIQKHDLEKVFNRFEKLNDFAQGTGLGMYICNTITQHLSGNIGVESEFGKGSTFWVEFPCTTNIE